MTPYPPQPFFTLFGSFYHCRFTLRCNGIPVCAHDVSGREMHVDMPVNLHLAPGPNELELELEAPTVEGRRGGLDDRQLSAELALAVRQKGDSYERAHLLGGFSYADTTLKPMEADDEGLLGAPPPAPTVRDATIERAVFRRLVTPAVSLPRWLWVDARPTPLDDTTVATVIGLYRQVWAAMQRKDVPALRAMSEDNAREAQQAFYLGSLEEGHQTLDFEGLVRRPSVHLLPMPTEGLRVEALADGRLLRLVGSDGLSAIRVVDRETGMGGAVSVMFCQAPGRGWVQIR
jgi:hypothetical protein